MTPSAQPLSNQSLESLQSDDTRKVMDTVDRLRKAGLDGIVQLPQIVTVGDQSSGKSSTLEAITGIPFPRKENLCTRFATQIVMRRERTESVSVEIIPDKLRPVHEQKKLKAVKLTLDDFSKLGDLMDTATAAMGLDSPKSPSQVRAFSRDVLNIEISGPTRPQLTLVDLPGMIHSETKQQSREDVKLITELVEEYIKEKRTIVLAVVSAKNDYANQIVLKKARDLDATDRTLGIVTKTDILEPDTENEKDWFELAQNKNVMFGFGWHMVRNRTPKEMDKSLEFRDQAEQQFFSSGNYRNLDQDMLGIQKLRTRLSTLLYDHLTKELPLLQEELTQKHDQTLKELAQLGQARATMEEQKHYLLHVGQAFEKIAGAAVAGNYHLDYFTNIDTGNLIMHDQNVKRLRAAVQDANMQFATQMRRYGSKFKVSEPSSGPSDPENGGDDSIFSHKSHQEPKGEQQSSLVGDPFKRAPNERKRGPGSSIFISEAPASKRRCAPEAETSDPEDAENDSMVLHKYYQKVESTQRIHTRTDTLKWAQNILERSRGRELPGNFNPSIIGHLFREQSSPWAQLAASHIDMVAKLCETFVDQLLRSITSQDVYTKLMTRIVKPELKSRTESAHQELARIVKDKNGEPITYNHYYTTTIQKIRKRKQERDTLQILKGYGIGSEESIEVNKNSLAQVLQSTATQQDMNKFGAEDALVCHKAYYKDELKFFVNCVTKHVIERHLLEDLASKIISTVRFGSMSADDIRTLAVEPAPVSQERDYLRKKKETLENGIKQFRFAAGGGGLSRGAYHESEINYVLNNLYGADLSLQAEDYAVAATMNEYWINFIRHGDPNGEHLADWPAATDAEDGTFQIVGNFLESKQLESAKLELFEEWFDTLQAY